MSIFNQIEIFYHVAKLNSFTKAALKLGLSKGYVSMLINDLEKDLGVKLLNRTTRHISLTEAGKLFFSSCEIIMQEKDRATAVIEEIQKEPVGKLTITAPPSLCATLLATIVPAFLKAYPKITLEIDSTGQKRDLIKENIDVAFRITKSPDENYIAKLITNFQLIVCASPAYLQKHGEPKTPQDLHQHNCLAYTVDPSHSVWPFIKNNVMEEVQVRGNLEVGNSNIIHKALLEGAGIARLPSYFIHEDLKSGKLQMLFNDYEKVNMPIYAVYLHAAIALPKLQVFLAFVKQRYKIL